MNERERLIRLIGMAKKQACVDILTADIDTAIDMPRGDEYLAAYLLANGVIVPPCKVGQTVFCIRYDKARKPFVKPLEICSIASFGAGKFMVFTTKLDTWGVTAFATREEAEKALAEREQK